MSGPVGAVPTSARLMQLGIKHTCFKEEHSCYLCAIDRVHELGYHIDNLAGGLNKLETFYKTGTDALLEHVIELRHALDLAENYIRNHTTPTAHQIALVKLLADINQKPKAEPVEVPDEPTG